MLKAKLVVVGGDADRTEVKLTLPAILGRGRDVDLVVPQALVSRRHAEIRERDGRLYVEDIGSTNGTFVNNQRIEGETPLDPEQLLTLGSVTFRAIYEIADHSDLVAPELASASKTATEQPAALAGSHHFASKAPSDESTLPLNQFPVALQLRETGDGGSADLSGEMPPQNLLDSPLSLQDSETVPLRDPKSETDKMLPVDSARCPVKSHGEELPSAGRTPEGGTNPDPFFNNRPR